MVERFASLISSTSKARITGKARKFRSCAARKTSAFACLMGLLGPSVICELEMRLPPYRDRDRFCSLATVVWKIA